MQSPNGHIRPNFTSNVAQNVMDYLTKVALADEGAGTSEEALRRIAIMFEQHERNKVTRGFRCLSCTKNPLFYQHATDIASTQFKRLYDDAERRLLIWDEERIELDPDWPPLTPGYLRELRLVELDKLRELTRDFIMSWTGNNDVLYVTDGFGGGFITLD